MAIKYMNSKLFTINMQDFGRGLLVAILSAVITYLYQAVQGAGLLSVDLNSLLQVGLTAMLAYLLKNLGTNSANQLGKRE